VDINTVHGAALYSALSGAATAPDTFTFESPT
jgi:hypothetical protein